MEKEVTQFDHSLIASILSVITYLLLRKHFHFEEEVKYWQDLLMRYFFDR